MDALPPIDQAALDRWYARRGWTAFDYQREVWAAHAAGESGLIHAPTGSGKTLAAAFAALLDPGWPAAGPGLIWLTPMRALAADTCSGLQAVCAELGLSLRIELRTGDTPSSLRARQRRDPPQVLITTPESAALLLTHADVVAGLRGLRTVVVDEWHELLGSKRGVQTELVLSRLRSVAPTLRTWGLSATLGNLDQALQVLLGPGVFGRCISAPPDKPVLIDCLLPAALERFPWAGHMGLGQAPEVHAAIREARSTLVFCNTRAQAERWFEALHELAPDLRLALHHGSLDSQLRAQAEAGLREGRLDAVVATSSLDLGVDFSPVDQVIQIGGPKGIARLLQRAGRSGHRPGATSRIRCVATQAIELAEFAAARAAAQARRIESRRPLRLCLDVLAQHVVSLALTAELSAAQIRAQIQRTHAYAELGEDDWQWVLDFVTRGGATLSAYPQYRKVVVRQDGILTVPDATLARRHRMSIGTIGSDSLVRLCWVRGGALGSVEESFVSRLRPGDSFLFAGRALTLVRVRDMTAQVRPGGGTRLVPRWQGGRMPLSSELAEAMVRLFAEPTAVTAAPELRTLAPLLDLQARWSALPTPGRLLVERTRSREGEHLFVFPFAGRRVHEGLAALLAWRLGRAVPASFRLAVNDYGFELMARELPELDTDELRVLFTPQDLDADLVASLNAAEMARRRFRDIARIAGLVFDGYPGSSKSVRQVQASAGLIYDVLERYDPGNRLTAQALREALDEQIDLHRLRATCARVVDLELELRRTARLTPLAFPLWAERIASSLSTEDWRTRVARMAQSLELAAEQSSAGETSSRAHRPRRRAAPAA